MIGSISSIFESLRVLHTENGSEIMDNSTKSSANSFDEFALDVL